MTVNAQPDAFVPHLSVRNPKPSKKEIAIRRPQAWYNPKKAMGKPVASHPPNPRKVFL
jgi:hypothetical protein